MLKSTGIRVVQETPSASFAPAQTDRSSKFIFVFRHTVVIERQFFAVVDLSQRVHANGVPTCRSSNDSGRRKRDSIEYQERDSIETKKRTNKEQTKNKQ